MVKNALHQTRQGRTTVIIAHRLTTIRDADIIMVFKEGRVVEQGTHDELMQIRNGIYQKLATQSEQKEEENQDNGIARRKEGEGESEDETVENESSVMDMNGLQWSLSRSSSGQFRMRIVHVDFPLTNVIPT